MLALGVLILPTWFGIVVFYLFGYPPSASFSDGIAQSLVSILLVVGGFVGVVGVWQTIRLLRRDHFDRGESWFRQAAVAIGVLALLAFNFVTDSFSLDGDLQSVLFLVAMLILPLACTAHIMFLGRTTKDA
jgi:hypothetical protein